MSVYRTIGPLVINGDLGVDLDLFYGKVKFGYSVFSVGKVKTVDFSELLQPVT